MGNGGLGLIKLYAAGAKNKHDETVLYFFLLLLQVWGDRCHQAAASAPERRCVALVTVC